MKLKLLIPGLFILLVSFSFTGELKTDDLIKQSVDAYLNNPENTGVSIGIVKGDKEYYYSYGTTSNPANTNIDANSLFEIGSITKIFTSIILAQDVLQHKASLEDKVSRYFPDISNRELDKVSLRDLVTHSSGLPRMATNFSASIKDEGNPYRSFGEQELKDYLSIATLNWEPGVKYLYSNVGVGLMGYILSQQHHLGYESLVQQKVCHPFGMYNTVMNFNGEQRKALALGHSNGNIVSNWDFQDATAGQGALRSSAKDMVKFIKMNLFPEQSPFKDAILLTQQLQFTDKNNGRQMGMGWHMGTFRNEKYLEHTGGTGGYRSFICVLPESKMGIIVMSNSNNDVGALGSQILKMFYNNNKSS